MPTTNPAAAASENTLRQRRKHRVISISAGIVLLLLMAFLAHTFAHSYKNISEAVQEERIEYLGEMTAQIIASHSYMCEQYGLAADSYAEILENSNAVTLRGARHAMAGREDLLLYSDSGDLFSLAGDTHVLATQQLGSALAGFGDRQLFMSLDYERDYWLFLSPVEGVVLDGLNISAVVLAVPSGEYRDKLCISMFDGSGASYLVDSNGAVLIKPEDGSLVFRGYNLLAALENAGAPEDELSPLRQGLSSHGTGSLPVHIGGADWLLSYAGIDDSTSIVVLVPLYITADKTYESLQDTIANATLLVVLLAACALLIVWSLSLRDRRRRREAEAAAAKSEFFSKMSHDIRTPLNSILGLELLAKDSSTEPAVQDYLRQSTASANYLLSIINDVLDMSRIESGKLMLKSEPFSMDALISEVNTIIRPMVVEKALDYRVTPAGDVFSQTYIGDQVRIKQVIMNLLSNAVKFTRIGGMVSLNVDHHPAGNGKDFITLTVSDTGIGISPDYLPRLFAPFEQARSSYTQSSGGSGLGLSIVHSLVEMMGGEIEVDTQEGVGSTFTVRLTLERGEAPLPDVKKEDEPAGIFPGCRVLLTEDSSVNQKVAATILRRRFELQVDTADDGKQAVDMFKASQPFFYDLILMDVKMPVMDGLDATRAIRALPREDAGSVPIVALSANAFEEDVALSLEAGMNDHMSKPLDIARLAEALQKHLRRKI